jgi:hypothetical protein
MVRRSLKNSGSGEGAKGTIQLGRSGIVGWDWLELTYDEAHENVERREISGFPKPCWMPFANLVPVFFGQNMGYLIAPVPGPENQLCRHWDPIPGGFNNIYLVASTACIKELARYDGHDEPWFYGSNLVWKYTDQTIFRPCLDACIDDPKQCHKKPQVLEFKKGNTLKRKTQHAAEEPLL